VAADKRREKDFDGALQTYQTVLKSYPADAEDALWGTGWTQYLSGDHRKAAETFSGFMKHTVIQNTSTGRQRAPGPQVTMQKAFSAGS